MNGIFKNNLLLIRNLGRISYSKFIDVQNGISSNKMNNNDDKNILILAEHSSPLFSYDHFNSNNNNNNNNSKIINNRNEKIKKLKEIGYDICKVTKRSSNIINNNENNENNNGTILWHGPGQLTCYPILSNQLEMDEKQYKVKLENVILKSLDQLTSIKCIIENDSIKTIDKNEIIGNVKIFDDFYNVPGFSLNINQNFRQCNEIYNDEDGDSEHKNISSIWKITNSNNLAVSDVIPIVVENFQKEFGFQQIDPYSYYMSQINSLPALNIESTTNNYNLLNQDDSKKFIENFNVVKQ